MEFLTPYVDARQLLEAAKRSPANDTALGKTVTVVGVVRAAMEGVPYILVDGPDERQFMVNRKVAGRLWNQLQADQTVILEVVPGEVSRVVSVSRPPR